MPAFGHLTNSRSHRVRGAYLLLVVLEAPDRRIMTWPAIGAAKGNIHKPPSRFPQRPAREIQGNGLKKG